MNKSCKALIEAYPNKWVVDDCVAVVDVDITDADILELLQSGEEVHSQHEGSNRWWEDWSYVVKIGDKYFRYWYAEANRDESVRELGYEWDVDSVEEVTPVKKVVEITEYVPVKE